MAKRAKHVVWAPKAQRDVIDIWKYLAKASSPETADQVLRDIDRAVHRLRAHPFLGRPRDEISSGLRSLLVHPHLVIYRVTEQTIEIARILHERRDLTAALAMDRR